MKFCRKNRPRNIIPTESLCRTPLDDGYNEVDAATLWRWRKWDDTERAWVWVND